MNKLLLWLKLLFRVYAVWCSLYAVDEQVVNKSGGGWVGVLDESKAISAQLGLGFGLSLAK